MGGQLVAYIAAEREDMGEPVIRLLLLRLDAAEIAGAEPFRAVEMAQRKRPAMVAIEVVGRSICLDGRQVERAGMQHRVEAVCLSHPCDRACPVPAGRRIAPHMLAFERGPAAAQNVDREQIFLVRPEAENRCRPPRHRADATLRPGY